MIYIYALKYHYVFILIFRILFYGGGGFYKLLQGTTFSLQDNEVAERKVAYVLIFRYVSLSI